MAAWNYCWSAITDSPSPLSACLCLPKLGFAYPFQGEGEQSLTNTGEPWLPPSEWAPFALPQLSLQAGGNGLQCSCHELGAHTSGCWLLAQSKPLPRGWALKGNGGCSQGLSSSVHLLLVKPGLERWVMEKKGGGQGNWWWQMVASLHMLAFSGYENDLLSSCLVGQNEQQRSQLGEG